MELSIVVPVFNEEENVANLHQEIKTVCEENKYTYEIIFIDDGSKDKTRDVIRSLSPVKLISLRRNFGQTAAMDAGLQQAKYGYIVTMDGDGQNDPTDIPRLIKHLEDNNLDVVSGWRKSRKDPFMKRFISRGANFLRTILVHDGIHDSGCSLKIYKNECFNNLALYGEMHRFIPALLKIRGFKIGEIEVNHRPRTAGITKYNWRRTVKGLIDMISVWFWNKFAVRPLHLMGGAGLFFIFMSFVSGIVTLFQFLRGQNMSDTAYPLLTMFLFFSGLQLFVFGLIADILLKSYFETTKNQSYSVKEVFEK